MELKLDEYPTKSLLSSYEFIFSQYLGGQLTPPHALQFVATPYIFGEICEELRRQYLLRKDGSEQEIRKIEDSCIKRISAMMNVPKEKLMKICEEMIAASEEHFRAATQSDQLNNDVN